MPQGGLDFMGRKEGVQHNTFKASHLVSGQRPDRRLVNGGVFQRPAASETSESSKTGSPDFPKPPCTINGYVNHGYKKKSTKAAPPKALRTQKNNFLPVSDSSVAGVVGNAEVLFGVSATRPVNLCSKPEKEVPDPSPSASEKNRRRRRKTFRWKKKSYNEVTSSESSTLPHDSVQELEDWEEEIQEVTTLKDWGKMCFGITPYELILKRQQQRAGLEMFIKRPEDLIQFTLRGLSLQHSATVDQPVTANYSPAVHHACPIQWICYSVRSEPDQFANAEL